MKLLATLALGVATFMYGQIPNPTQQIDPNQRIDPNRVATDVPQPIFRVTVVSRSIMAVNYQHRHGATKVALHGTELMPLAKGVADVTSNTGATRMTVRFEKLDPATKYGPEFLTYVIWAITPEGRAKSIGEVASLHNDGKAEIVASTDLQAFGLIVTAEPYWAVSQPSDVVVMENFLRDDTTGTIEQVNAKYELLKRGTYVMNLNGTVADPFVHDEKVPLQLREARLALDIAKAQGGERFAADTMHKAAVDLRNAEDFYRNKHVDAKSLETNAREATQMAEDARIVSIRHEADDALAAERAAAASREQSEKDKATAEQQARMQADQARMQADQARAAAETDRAAAERARAEAQTLASRAERDRAAAEAAKQAAMAGQQSAQADADRARLVAQQAEAEKQQMRQRLLAQLNLILVTRDSARGLIVNMSDVLFDFGKATLKPGAREKLAKVSGIVLAYPGLKLAVEGHTDAIGSEEFNMTLSEKRANAVREYLVTQGLNGGTITAQGFGKADPVATNDTAEGRALNRRVEMVVSGEAIGISLGSPTAGLSAPPVQ